jgi:hypothetical protein
MRRTLGAMLGFANSAPRSAAKLPPLLTNFRGARKARAAAEGKRLMGQPISIFLSLELGLSGINRVTSRKGGKGGFEVPPVPFLFQG